MKKSKWLDCQGNEFFPKQKGTPSLVKIEHKNTATLDSARSKKNLKSQFCNYIGEHCLTQVVDIPKRNDKTLDLLFTNFQSPVNRVKGMPPIGKADHDIVYVEYDIKAKRLEQASRKTISINVQIWSDLTT